MAIYGGFDDDGRLEAIPAGQGEMAAAMGEELRRLRGEMAATEQGAEALAGSISGSLRNAFDRMVTGGRSASDVMRGLGRDLMGRTFDAAVRPLQGALTEGLTAGFGGLLGAASGGVTAFAKGGVVSGPTYFGMAGGLGLMGEAGPEAVMPLTRGPDGRLGVAAGGGGGARVTVNVTTPDVAGFSKSRAQVAAQMARALRRGARHG